MADESLTIRIDGLEASAQRGETVLHVARRLGVYIPTLCHVDALKPLGACRMCLVEISGPTMRPRLVTACTRPVFEGMEVKTDTTDVEVTRRINLQLLLGRAPNAPRLLEMAERYKVHEDEVDLDPDAHGCILCGLCVRVCAERIGREAIAFSGRTNKRRVTAAFEALSETCIGCGTCANLCPTGCLHVIDDEKGVRRLFNDDIQINEFELLRCDACGQPFTTDAYLKWLDQNVDVPPPKGYNEERLICPDCARAVYARKVDPAGY